MRFLWKFILRHLAKAQGFLDPVVVFSNLQHFSKPSEVWVPVELLRSGAVLQARGLINSQAIQNNLDWVWPYWVERQFNPSDKAFIPRAFSLTHINLTHRNWTALGLPNYPDFPIVDPCGLVTPFFDGWSLDAWIVNEAQNLIPSRLAHVDQNLDLDNTFAVLTSAQNEKFILESRAEVEAMDAPVCKVTFTAQAGRKAWLMVCVRPYNPEGVSFIKDIACLSAKEGWLVNKKEEVWLDKKPAQYRFANYTTGDLLDNLNQPDGQPKAIACKIGMATSCAAYPLVPGTVQELTVRIPLPKEHAYSLWPDHLEGVCGIKLPDEKLEFLFNTAVKTMVLHSPGDVYPGPFTYKRFWFRDAAFILRAMTAIGLTQNIPAIFDRFLERQTPVGYYKSQAGEWDSNGQAIWVMKRFIDSTLHAIKPQWRASIYRAAKWIERKRVVSDSDPVHNGLLPAGFSAEHFGPSDFYYWDDFWSAAGLKDAAALAREHDPVLAKEFDAQAEDLLHTVENSINLARERLGEAGIPASPTRRMDAGAVGCLVASYPLQILAPNDPRILETVHFLMEKYFLQGAFYHEISHSGINIYLTLHIAQVLLRAGNPRFFNVVKSVADLATPTGQWPEAIHPRTKGGCMGDGQHVWASAEWVMMLRNMFVREEESGRTLILCSGLPKMWLKYGEELFLGPTGTPYGEISLTVKVHEHIEVSWEAAWHGTPPAIEVRLPGHEPVIVEEGVDHIKINPAEVLV